MFSSSSACFGSKAYFLFFSAYVCPMKREPWQGSFLGWASGLSWGINVLCSGPASALSNCEAGCGHSEGQKCLRRTGLAQETKMPEELHTQCVKSPILCRMRYFWLLPNREIQVWCDSRCLEQWGTGCSTREYRHGVVKDVAQAGTGDPRSYTQLTGGQLKKCRPGAGETGFSGNRQNKNSIWHT